MNKKQWYVFGIGFLILSGYLFNMAMGWGSCGLDEIMHLICNIRRYAYAIPAIITHFLGWIFIICGFFEDKKK
jgi:hypothetical protein